MFTSKSKARSYELTLSENYVANWGVMEAVRELLQNALDSDSPFEAKFTKQGDTFGIQITSRNSTLPINSLILGNTSKADNEDSIGTFGEGYKLAMLVLKRNDKGCLVLNGDRVWAPELQWSERFQCNLLTIHEREIDLEKREHGGLTFIIDHLTEEEVIAIKRICLHLRPERPELVAEGRYGAIMKEDEPSLYVNGLWVCELKEYHYSYNIKPPHLKLERDRKTVSDFDLGFITTQMWYETERYEEVARMIDSESQDTYYARYNAPQMVKEACWKLFQEQYPNHIPAESKAQLEKLVQDGFTKTVVVNDGMYAACAGSEGLRSAAPTFELSPYGRLNEFFKKNRSLMRRRAIVDFKELMKRAQDERWS